MTQDRRGPVEVAAYRLEDGHYVPETTAKLGDGPASSPPVTCPSSWTSSPCDCGSPDNDDGAGVAPGPVSNPYTSDHGR
ncbi:hypothetical protein FHX42_003069 [Saccharopolyspora lacisalsi]|uniref:Uncharacterized protein n=1 Tax=Halosaccharopolyspora lacisalsi TaxID=1000566 RepID=A0A839DXD1_9PSEU|nr:hypothetical protein [Halosaccharopolyspora lacisalsi]MBA8825703.1 hypothetical protein [Halosaccharopolyspora lacisalsi]